MFGFENTMYHLDSFFEEAKELCAKLRQDNSLKESELLRQMEIQKGIEIQVKGVTA